VCSARANVDWLRIGIGSFFIRRRWGFFMEENRELGCVCYGGGMTG
jgi:hypothetical protein